MNFIKLCNEVGIWSEMNFGQQPADNPLLGVLEEIGEISHSFLKSLQGIRGSEAEHIDAMKDGIGDAMIFLADFCYRANLVKSFVDLNFTTMDFQDMVFSKPFGEPQMFLFHAAGRVRDIYDSKRIGNASTVTTITNTLLYELSSFSNKMHFNFAECVMSTWGIVKQRDWTKNKLTGGA